MNDLTVHKISAYLPLSREMALDHGLVEPTEAEQRQMETARVEYERRKRAATAAWPGFVAALTAITDPVARALLDLHRSSERGECVGCEFGGYDAEPPAWPCQTTYTIAQAVGVVVPPDLWMAEQHQG